MIRFFLTMQSIKHPLDSLVCVTLPEASLLHTSRRPSQSVTFIWLGSTVWFARMPPPNLKPGPEVSSPSFSNNLRPQFFFRFFVEQCILKGDFLTGEGPAGFTKKVLKVLMRLSPHLLDWGGVRTTSALPSECF